jgi:pyruvate formate lyase activating enzyme
LKTLDYLDEIKKPYWLRQVIVPWYTNDEEDLKKLWEYVKTRTSMERLELLPYHNMWVSKWEKMKLQYPLKWVPAASIDDLNKAKAILDKYSDKVFLRG